MSALYKITTISDNGNEKSTEWGTWAMTKKDFRDFAAIWIAALVMPYGDLPYVHKIIITDKTGNNIYTFIIHPRSAFSSSTLIRSAMRTIAAAAIAALRDGRITI